MRKREDGRYRCDYCGECPGCAARVAELEVLLANSQGFVRRLEKANQALGEENHRLKGEGTGWNAT